MFSYNSSPFGGCSLLWPDSVTMRRSAWRDESEWLDGLVQCDASRRARTTCHDGRLIRTGKRRFAL